MVVLKISTGRPYLAVIKSGANIALVCGRLVQLSDSVHYKFEDDINVTARVAILNMCCCSRGPPGATRERGLTNI